MKARAAGLLAALFFLLANGAGALDSRDLIFRWDVRLWGADAALGYRGWSLFPGVDTILWASAGGGWQSLHWFDASDDASDDTGTAFSTLAFDWRLGVSQGILHHPTEDRNLLEAVLLYRGKLQRYADDAGLPATLPDREGLLQNSLLAALVLDGVTRDRQRITRDGLYGSLSAEWVPGFFYNNVLGDSDYSRFSVVLCGFRTLYSSDSISLYAADRVLWDLLVGEDGRIPISALSGFGGLTKVPISSNPFRGLGGSVRGLQKERYDGRIKLANNLDLRLHLPAWRMFGRFVPGLVAYLDAGVSDQGGGQLFGGPLLASTGAGVLLNGFGFDFIGYVDYFINEGDVSFSLGLGAHF